MTEPRTYRMQDGYAMQDSTGRWWVRPNATKRWEVWTPEAREIPYIQSRYSTGYRAHKLLMETFEDQRQQDELRKHTIKAIVMMAEEMAKACYGIESDKEYWRIFVPRDGQISLGWKVHEWHTPDDHDCRDDPACVLCDLSVCRICGLYEGGLTTECPGERVPFEVSEKVYRERLDYRHGKWVEELSPHRQSCEMHQVWKRDYRRNR